MISAAIPSVRCDRERNRTVLVVEEDDVARSFLADNLKADRYQVRTADSREKALAILSVQQPDVIVVDVNGQTLDLIDAIRDGDGLAGGVDPDTPLIVLTTRVDELHRIRVLDRGGDDVLAKPYSYPELRGFISSLGAPVVGMSFQVFAAETPAESGGSAPVCSSPQPNGLSDGLFMPGERPRKIRKTVGRGVRGRSAGSAATSGEPELPSAGRGGRYRRCRRQAASRPCCRIRMRTGRLRPQL